MTREKPSTRRPPILATSVAGLVRNPKLFLRTLPASVLAAAAMLGLATEDVQATVYTWQGTTASWSTSSNWTPAGPPAFLDDVQFGTLGTVTTTNNNIAGSYLDSITFLAGAPSYTLTGNSTFLDAGGFYNNEGLTNNSTATQTIAFGGDGLQLAVVSVANNTQVWDAAAGNIVVQSNVIFSSAMTLVVTGSHDITINGVISDATGGALPNLLKTGSGTLTLNGQNTYTGDTTVSGGLLQVEGAIASMRTFVTPGGTLGGAGVIGGTVNNSGNVAPGNGGTGTLTVKGNYNQTGGGTLTVGIAGSQAGEYGAIAAGGQANLNGSLRLVQIGNAPRLSVGQKIAFITAAGGVNGTFSSVSNPFQNASGTIVSEQVVYNRNDVSLEGVQGSFQSFAQASGLSPNQIAVAGGLDHIAFRNQQPKLITYLDSQPLSKLPDDFEKISPDQLTSIFTIGVSLANVQTMNLQRRTDDIRNGSNGFSAAGFQTAGSGPLYSGSLGSAGPSGDDGKESKEMKEVAPPENRWGVFITGTGEWVNVSGDGNGRNYDVATGGFTLGADYKVTPNFAIGVDAGYAGTASDLNDGGRVYVNGGKLGLYSTYFTGGFYVDTAVNGGFNSYDTTRASIQGTARGSTEGGEFNALFGTGYDFKVGGWSIGPTASFQYTDIGISGFNERSSLAPLTFRSQSQDSLRTAVGFKTSYDWKVGGIVIKPELRAAWQHEYGDNSYQLDSSFAGGGGDLFSVNGPKLGRDSLLLGAGFAIMWNERTSTYVYYDGELARTNYDSQNVSAGIRISF